MRLPFPRHMTARIALILVAALSLELCGNLMIDAWHDRELISTEQTRRLAERLVIAERLIISTPPERRQALTEDLRTEGLIFNWVPATVIVDSSANNGQLRDLKARFAQMAPQLAGKDIRLVIVASTGSERDLIGTVRIADNSFVTFRISPYLSAPMPVGMTLLLHLLLMTFVLGLALLLVRAIVKPLRELSDLADATGPGTLPSTIVRGPLEVRRVAVAFAAMRARLLSIMNDHTQALVAVSHDLRTPIQRLRLRLSLLRDEEARETMSADLSDMERFIGSIVSYMHSNEQEEARLIDVAAIAMTAVDNAADLGADIDYQGPDELVTSLRPLALKRALGNLIENAVKYAGQIRVAVRPQAGQLFITVEDDGPGIAPADRDTACLPFRRLAPELDPGGEGTGLGLAITKNAVASLSGDLILGESSLGGLAATIRLPIDQPEGDYRP